MQTKATLSILLLVILGHSALPQGGFYSYSQADGLPNEIITCLSQDMKGFIWIGTANGLSRFDGAHFYNFPPGPLSSSRMGGDLILDIEEDGNIMWVAHRFGITKVDRYSFVCENFQTPDGGSKYFLTRAVRDIYKDPNGQIWLCSTSNLYRFDKEFNRMVKAASLLKHWTKEGSNISKIIPENGNLLLFVADGYFRFNIAEKRLDSVLHKEIPITFLKGQNIRVVPYWNTIATSLGIYYHTASGSITLSNNSPPGAVIHVKNIFVDDSLTLFINLESNQTIIWKSNGTKIYGTALTGSPLKATPLQFNWAQSRYGHTWYATNNGLLASDPAKSSVMIFNFSDFSNAGTNIRPTIHHVAEYDERHWLVSTQVGIFLMDRADHSIHALRHWKDSSIRRAIALPDKSIWLSTENTLYHYYPATGKTGAPIAIGTYAVAFYVRGNLLIAGTRSHGIVILNKQGGMIKSLREGARSQANITDRITSIEPAGKTGDFLITYNDTSAFTVANFETGVYRSMVIPGRTHPFKEWFSVHTICSALKKTWIGHYIGGISVYDSITRKWSVITSQQGLASNDMYKILADDAGRLWLLNSVGIDILDPVSGSIYKFPVSLDNGAKSGMFMGADGKIVVHDQSKIMQVDAGKLALHTPSKKVVIGQVTQDTTQLLNPSRTIRLPYNKNHCTVVFAVPGLEKGTQPLYSYRLHRNDAWTNIGIQATLNFGSLTPGRYELQIRATDEFRQWSYYSEMLTLIIRPPFWMTLPFYVLMAVLCATVIYLLYYFRVKQLKKIIGVREKISRDLHDDIGSTISSLHIYGGLAQNAWQSQPGKSREMLELIIHHSRDLMQQMSDIIWSLQPVGEEKYSFESRLKNYSHELLAAREIKFAFEIDESLNNRIVNPFIRKNILLIAKEAMSNIAKYSGAQMATISLTQAGAYVVLAVQDDGRGFDTSVPSKGNGLGNMKYRCLNMKGEYKIVSSPGSGTLVQCFFSKANISRST